MFEDPTQTPGRRRNEERIHRPYGWHQHRRGESVCLRRDPDKCIKRFVFDTNSLLKTEMNGYCSVEKMRRIS